MIGRLKMLKNFYCKLFIVFARVAHVKELQQMKLVLNVS